MAKKPKHKNKSNIVTNSIKTLKLIYVNKIFKKNELGRDMELQQGQCFKNYCIKSNMSN